MLQYDVRLSRRALMLRVTSTYSTYQPPLSLTKSKRKNILSTSLRERLSCPRGETAHTRDTDTHTRSPTPPQRNDLGSYACSHISHSARARTDGMYVGLPYSSRPTATPTKSTHQSVVLLSCQQVTYNSHFHNPRTRDHVEKRNIR